jgi:peroxiredoxin
VYSFESLKGFRAAVFISLVTTAVGASGSVHATDFRRVNVGVQAPAFNAPGADGKQHRLRDYAGKLVVLEWTNPVCPFTAVKYKSGTIQALQRYAASHKVVWISIDTAAPDKAGYLTAAAAKERIAQTHATITAFLFDKDGSIARSYGAKTTPSFFIVDREGKLAYQGAMDDQVFGDDGQGREYMKAALDDLFAGHRVTDSQTQPQGCAIEY